MAVFLSDQCFLPPSGPDKRATLVSRALRAAESELYHCGAVALERLPHGGARRTFGMLTQKCSCSERLGTMRAERPAGIQANHGPVRYGDEGSQHRVGDELHGMTATTFTAGLPGRSLAVVSVCRSLRMHAFGLADALRFPAASRSISPDREPMFSRHNGFSRGLPEATRFHGWTRAGRSAGLVWQFAEIRPPNSRLAFLISRVLASPCGVWGLSRTSLRMARCAPARARADQRRQRGSGRGPIMEGTINDSRSSSFLEALPRVTIR